MMSKPRNVLAIDGGGIRGLIPALVLSHIETLTGRPSAQVFDLIAGTSTGGILAMGLAHATPDRPHQPRYRAADLAELYRQRGADIFSRSLWRRLRSVNGLFDETYDADALERALDDYFGDGELGRSCCPVMVTAYDIERRSTVFIKSFKEEHRSVRCRHAGRATSAAPTYFEPARTEINGERRALIDGGVYMNAPAVSAYAEALKLFPGDPIRVVSLGTGELTEPITRDRARDWGSAGWVMPLLDCMFDGMAKATDHQMELFLGERYVRLQLQLDDASEAMDDASPDNIAALARAAERLIAHEADRLAQLAGWLKSG